MFRYLLEPTFSIIEVYWLNYAFSIASPSSVCESLCALSSLSTFTIMPLPGSWVWSVAPFQKNVRLCPRNVKTEPPSPPHSGQSAWKWLCRRFRPFWTKKNFLVEYFFWDLVIFLPSLSLAFFAHLGLSRFRGCHLMEYSVVIHISVWDLVIASEYELIG